ncbi:MAG: VIT1/CCC1 transporter family protein [Anaerolineaceae bacterium]
MKKKSNPLKRMLERISEYNEIAEIGEIARRYFAMNAFDGVLTIIGVLMGHYAAGVDNPMIVVTTGLTTSVAIGISGLWGSFLTESAERKRGIDEISRSTLTDQNGSKIGKASRFAAVAVAIIDGVSPFVASIVVLIPFFFANLFANIHYVYYVSIGFALLVLFGLGMFLGKISKQNLIIMGLKTLAAGLVSILISTLLGTSH